MLLSDLREYDIRDYDHEVRAQHPNPIGTPHRHHIKNQRFKPSRKPSRDEAETGKGKMKTAKSVEGKKAVDEKEAPKKAKKAEKTTWGTSDVAKQLGIDPKTFRAMLRQSGQGSGGHRYEWPIGDPLKKERRMIEDWKEKQEERAAAREERAEKAEKPAKKKAKPVEEEEEEEETPKKPAKKAKKVVEVEEEEESEEEEEDEEAEELE
jgi:hypothetical protein